MLFERRSLNNPGTPLTADGIMSILGSGMSTDSGVAVSEFSALQMAAVWRCVSLISSAIAGLPLRTYKDAGDGFREEVPNALLANPHPELTRYELIQMTLLHILLWGNAYILKIPNVVGNRIVRLLPIQPWKVVPTRKRISVDGLTDYFGDKQYQVVAQGAPSEPLTDDEILHIPGLGYDGLRGLSKIAYLRQSIGVGLAAEQFGARFFGSGSLVSGFIKSAKKLDQTQANVIKQNWRERMTGLARAHEVAVLDGSLEFVPLTMPNDDAQFMETRRFAVEEVARFYGVPPHLVGAVEKSTSWGAGIAEQSLGFVRYTLSEYMVPYEQRVTKELLPAGQVAEFDTDRILRGDAAARWAVYATGKEIDVLTKEDICRAESLPKPPPEPATPAPVLSPPPPGGVPPNVGKTPAGV